MGAVDGLGHTPGRKESGMGELCQRGVGLANGRKVQVGSRASVGYSAWTSVVAWVSLEM